MNNQSTPIVGMGVTQFVGSDRYPFHVKEVVSPKKIVVQSANYRRTDSNGYGGQQTYEITPNADGSERIITLRKNGRWVEEGDSAKGCGYSIGEADAYQDPSF